MTQAAVAASNAGLMTTPSGTAPNYMARAWVNFNGQGTVAIRASGNVSSITDGGVGIYTVNFTTAMPDANYSAVCTRQRGNADAISTPDSITTSGFIIRTALSTSAALEDALYVFTSVFR